MVMEKFIENLLRRIEEVKELVELRQKLIEHYGHEKQKQNYMADRTQKEREYVR